MPGKIQTIPDPMPEEPAKGYGGRLARWNGLDGRADLAKIAQDVVAGPLPTSTKEIVLLARLVEKKTERFVRDHTFMPYTQSMERERYGENAFGSEEALEQISNSGFRLARRHPHYCPQCLAEDRPYHGFTYWRREPQLPGRAWCFKHFCPLSWVAGADVFSLAPSMAAKASVVLDSKWVERLMQAPLLHRFFNVQDGLLSLKAPLRQSPVSRMLRDRATQLGFHSGRGKVKGRLLSEHLREVVDKAWLADVFPGLDEAHQGYFEPIDAATRGHHNSCSPTGYAIAAAVLWDDADEALNEILGAERNDVVREARPKTQPLADTAVLKKAYVDAAGNHVEVARQLALPQSSVASTLKALGLPALGQPDDRVLKAAHDFLHRGYSLEKAAIANQIPLEELEKFVRQAMVVAGSAIERRLAALPATTSPSVRCQVGLAKPIPDQNASQKCSPGLRSSKSSKRSGERLSKA